MIFGPKVRVSAGAGASLFKATAVQVSAGIARANGRNLLRGHVIQTSRAAASGEVALALPASLQLVGFAGPGHGLRLHDAAVAGVDQTAVVLALAG